MAVYTYLAADLLTNEILEELPLTGVSFESILKGAGEFSASMHLRQAVRRETVVAPALFTRASAAINPADFLAAAVNQPRWAPRGILIEEGTTNIVADPSFEAGLGTWSAGASYWTNTGATPEHSSTWAVEGTKSIRVVTTGASNQQGMRYNTPAVLANTTYTVTAYLYLESGRPIRLSVRDGTNAINGSHGAAANGSGGANGYLATTGVEVRQEWQITTGAIAPSSLLIAVATDTTAGVTAFRVDCIQVEAKARATSFVVGTRDGETLLAPLGVLSSSAGTVELEWQQESTASAAGRIFQWGAGYSSPINDPDFRIVRSSDDGNKRCRFEVSDPANGSVTTVGVNPSVEFAPGRRYYACARWRLTGDEATGVLSFDLYDYTAETWYRETVSTGIRPATDLYEPSIGGCRNSTTGYTYDELEALTYDTMETFTWDELEALTEIANAWIREVRFSDVYRPDADIETSKGVIAAEGSLARDAQTTYYLPLRRNNLRATSGKSTTSYRNSDLLTATTPNRTAIYVDRDGVLVWGGVIWTRQWGKANGKISIGGNEFWSYFRKRFIADTKAYTNIDQLEIARDIIDYVQGKTNGDIGVVTGAETSGRLRVRNYFGYELKQAGEAVEQLSDVIDGFDFSIDVRYGSSGEPEKVLNLSYPRRGRNAGTTGLVFELPGNITDYTWPEDGTGMSTKVHAVGAGEGLDMLRTSASDQIQLDAGWPLLEDVVAYKDVSVATTLGEHVQADLAMAREPVTIPTLTVRADMDPVLGGYITGDEARIRIEDDRFPDGLDTFKRITRIKTSPGDAEEAEQVVLTIGGVDE